jgi:hypothetical protein
MKLSKGAVACDCWEVQRLAKPVFAFATVAVMVCWTLVVVENAPRLGFHFRFGCRMSHCHGESKEAIAHLQIIKLMDETYPLWRAQHDGCPQMADLLATMDLAAGRHHFKDPWGAEILFTCAASTQLLVAVSWGEDTMPMTADDIWESRGWPPGNR